MKIFHEIDSDKNGFIEHSEFLTAALDHQMFLNELNLRKAFLQLDKDESGDIDMNELHSALGSDDLPEVEQKKIWSKFLVGIDADGDGKIDFEEFQTAMKNVIKERTI